MGNKIAKSIGISLIGINTLLSSCGQNENFLPLTRQSLEQRKQYSEENSQKIKQKYENIKQKVSDLEGNFSNQYNLAISDAYYSIGEQKKSVQILREIENNYRRMNELEILLGKRRSSIIPESKTLKRLLEKNVCYIDYGTPELQKVYQKSCISIQVEGYISGWDPFWPILALFMPLTIWTTNAIGKFLLG